MRRVAVLSLLSVAAFMAVAPAAEAQTRRRGEDALILNVRPRSYLDAGKVVPVGSMNRYATSQIQSYLASPPYIQMRDQFGEGTLPDPITNGPFVGARNPFGPIDFGGAYNGRY
jgi:hypothetical protein